MTGPDIRARLRDGLKLGLLLGALAACGPREPVDPLPPLPAVDTATLGNAAAAAIDTAYSAALAAPDSATLAGQYGMLLHAYGQTAAALTAYRRAMALDPAAPRWPVYRGLILYDDGDYNGARAMFETADPAARQPVVQVYLARTEAATGLREAATARLERVLSTHPRRLDALLERAALATIAEAPAEAAAFYRRALEIRPGLAEAHYGLAQVLRSLGETDAAAEQLAIFGAAPDGMFLADDDPRRDLGSSIESERTYIDTGKRLLASGEFEQARDAFERARAINPGNLSTVTNLIAVYGRLNDLERAAAAYRAALEISPEYYNAHYNFGVVAAYANQPGAAEKAFARAAAADPTRPEPFIEHGRMLARAGRPGLAITQYEKALELAPDNAAARFLLGQQLALAGDYLTASEHLERLVASNDPAAPGIMRVLAGVYGQAGDVQRAHDTLLEARDRAQGLGQTELAQQLEADLQRLAAGGGVMEN